jgi:replicative DNA helicase
MNKVPQLIGDIPLPHSAELELGVLSCMLQDPKECGDDVCILDATDFYIPEHRRLFEALKHLYNRQPATLDLITVGDYLDGNGTLEEIGGIPFIQRVYSQVPTIANLDTYLENVKAYGNTRRLIGTCSDLIGRAYEATPETALDLIDQAEREVLTISQSVQESGWISMTESITEAMKYIKGLSEQDPRYCGITTGFQAWDDVILGFRPGEVTVLAARPSIGKTAAGLNVTQRVARFKIPVGFVSLEMGHELLSLRQICSQAGINSRSFYENKVSKHVWQSEIQPSVALLHGLPIQFCDSTREWSKIRRHIRKGVKEFDFKLVIIDYLQLMTYRDPQIKTRDQEIERLSGEVKQLARDLDVHILVLAQLNRNAEKNNCEPKLHDLRGSGAIEQDADVVILMHRERETDSEETKRLIAEGRGIPTKFIVAKGRNTGTGVANLEFYPQFVRFSDHERIRDQDIPV